MWLLQRFGLSLAQAGSFFWAGLPSAGDAGRTISLPLVLCGVLKIAYDLALWKGLRGERLRGE